MPPPRHVRERRAALAAVAQDTLSVLPGILEQLPHLCTRQADRHTLDELPALKAEDCPNFELASSGPATYGTTIKVLNQDSFDAAQIMADSLTRTTDGGGSNNGNSNKGNESSNDNSSTSDSNGDIVVNTGTVKYGSGFRNQRVAVLNLASEKRPGGGWLTGAMAQEEALCYRSSLALSLHESHYPWEPLTGLYTRDVVIIRSSAAAGHHLLYPATPAADLAVVSVISVAGIRTPELKPGAAEEASAVAAAPAGGAATMTAPWAKFFKKKEKKRLVYGNPADRELTKQKMRLTLRIAAFEKHELLVLGAIGCGAFKNPPEEVADCWLEVLQEDEFKGGWFREIWFSVFDRRQEGNFEIFAERLGDREVGRVSGGGARGGRKDG